MLVVTLIHIHTHTYRVMLNHRILLMNDGMEHNVVKIKPPLCFTKENADSVLKAIEQTLQGLGH